MRNWTMLFLCAAIVACGADDGTVNEPADEPADTMQSEPTDEPEPDSDAEPVDEPEPEDPDPVEPTKEPEEPTEPPVDEPPTFGEWAQNFGGPDADIVEDVAADAEGNVYVTGTFREAITVGDVTLTAVPTEKEFSSDVFVASYGPDGSFRWATSFGSAEAEKPFGIATTPEGGIFVVGHNSGPLTFGSSILEHRGQADLFAVKYDADGQYQWSQSWGGQFTEDPRDIAVNEAGDLFITGSWQGLFTAGDQTYSAETDWSATEVLVLAIDGASGGVKWSNSFNGFLRDTGTTISADSAGNVVIGLNYQYDVDIGGLELSVGESWHAAIVRLDDEGSVVWTNPYGVEGEAVEVTGIELAEDGSVYATGIFSGTQNLGGDDLVNPVSGHDAFVLGLDGDGNHVFSSSYGSDGFDQPLDLVARGEQFYITGRYDGAIDFDSYALQSVTDAYDIFVASFSTAGDVRWARSFGGPGDDQANGIAIDPWSGVYVAGYNDGGDFVFNDAMMPAASEWLDAVVFRLEE